MRELGMVELLEMYHYRIAPGVDLPTIKGYS